MMHLLTPRKNSLTSIIWRLNSSLFILIVGPGIFISCGNSKKKDPDKIYFENASDYNNYITTRFDEVNRLWNEALTKMDDSLLIFKQLDSLTVSSDTCFKNMGKLADWHGDTLYKFAAGEYFLYMNSISKGKFKEAIEIGLKPDLSDEEYFRFTEIGNQIGAEKDTCIAKLLRAQANFAKLAQK